MHTVTFSDMQFEVRRELMMLGKVYQKWVANGTMTQGDAERHTARLSACGDLLAEIAASENPEVRKLSRDREITS